MLCYSYAAFSPSSKEKSGNLVSLGEGMGYVLTFFVLIGAPYDLSISSIARKTRVGNIMSSCYIYRSKENPSIV